MSKRRLSPVLLPPAKRLHTAEPQRLPGQTLTFDNSIYDELVLSIFSHLSWVDLCAAQATSRNWARLAADNELWRKLYLNIFGRTRLRGARGFITRSDGREVKPLPGRAKADDYRDWKWMFRISSNWKRGRCRAEALHTLPPSLSPQKPFERFCQTYIILAGLLTITASSQPTDAPVVHVTYTSNEHQRELHCESKLSDASNITALTLDQSPPTLGNTRLAAFLSTGEFVIFVLNHSQPSALPHKLVYIPTRRNPRTAPIIQAVYHHPLLVTLSQSFTLSIYDLSTESIQLSQSLTSFTSFPPTSLVLSTPTPTTYKLVLAYATPVYPAHWSVGVTELVISGLGPRGSGLEFSSNAKELTADPMTVISTRTIRAVDAPQGWIDERKLRRMREQWNRKVSRISDTQTDGKWVVLAPGDQIPYLPESSEPRETGSPSPSFPSRSSLAPVVGSMSSAFPSLMKALPMYSPTSLQLYRLSLPTQSSTISASPPKLTFVRALHGQSGPVSALALADGRCVSLGHNGSIWVWDLEGGTGAEVAAADEPAIGTKTEPIKGSVAFDERRIITALAGNVVVRRFDI